MLGSEGIIWSLNRLYGCTFMEQIAKPVIISTGFYFFNFVALFDYFFINMMGG